MILDKALQLWSSVGNTPLILLPSISNIVGANIFVKYEAGNPTGSVKDRGGMYNILQRIISGELTSGRTLLDASSGNMASAISYYANKLGIRAKVICSSKLTNDKSTYIRAMGAELETVGNVTIEGNRYCQDLARNNSSYVFLDQLHSKWNPQASYVSLGPEIVKQCPNIDLLVASVGSGGSLFGTSKFLKSVIDSLKVIPVNAAQGSKIPGVGGFLDGDYVTPFITQALENNLWEPPVLASSEESLEMMREIHIREGLFIGKQTGALLAAVKKLPPDMIHGKNIVLINGDAGWKNSSFIEQSLQ